MVDVCGFGQPWVSVDVCARVGFVDEFGLG